MKEYLRTKNLLLLEDDDDFIKHTVLLFNMFVKQTYVAQNISQAKEIFTQFQIDMIISDVHLKNENGLDFIQEIRELNQEIPIVVLSGYKDESLLLQAVTLNLSGYLLKPLNIESLTTILDICSKKIYSLDIKNTIIKDDLIYNKISKTLTRDKEIFILNKKEILFFDLLCTHKEKIITKDMIADFVYENEIMSDSAINNFILRLRKRFGKTFLYTISDVGYKLTL